MLKQRDKTWSHGHAKLNEDAAMSSSPVRFLIVDDHGLFRDGLASLLHAFPDITLVGEAHSGQEALLQVRQHKPQVVLMDLNMPEGSGATATSAILAEYPATTICMLTMSEDDADLFACIRAGARGYLLKDTTVDALHAAITVLADGGTVITPALATRLLAEFARMSPAHSVHDGPGVEQLTPREREVLEYVAAGWRNQDIADQLGIALNTVKVHLRNTLEKLELRNRHHLAAFAAREGLIGPPAPEH
jgi:DNA-binding NarL/FixJ family response regulator